MTRFAFSSAVYARHERAILLVHHKRLDVWVPVGGEIEPGESPLAAACRELFEETGLRHPATVGLYSPHIDGPPGFIGYEEHDAGSKGTHGTFSFLFDVASREVTLCGEHHAFMWFDGWASELASTHTVPPNVQRYLTKIRHLWSRDR